MGGTRFSPLCVGLVLKRFPYLTHKASIHHNARFIWKLGVLLTNARTLLDGGNIVSQYFGFSPMSALEYFSFEQDFYLHTP
jgi:hypothetical protein